MPLSREKKEELVAEYTQMLKESRALIVTDYRGLNTGDMTQLRRQVREADAMFVVIKNRLFRLAMQEAGLDIPEDFLDGPVAAGFCYGDVPPVAKALTQFADKSDILIVKGGLLDEKFFSQAEIKALADLPPLEVLRAQLLGLLDAPATNIAGIMASGVSQVVNVIAAYEEKGEGPADGAPPAEAQAEAAEPEPEAEAAEPEPEPEAEPEPEPEAEPEPEPEAEAETEAEANAEESE